MLVGWLVEKNNLSVRFFQLMNNLKVIMSCGRHSFHKSVKKPVFYCTISLYISTRYLDVAMRYFHVAKGVG